MPEPDPFTHVAEDYRGMIAAKQSLKQVRPSQMLIDLDERHLVREKVFVPKL